MKKYLFILTICLFFSSLAFATMPKFNRAVVWLNKPTIVLKNISNDTIKKLRDQVGVDSIEIGKKEGIAYIAVEKNLKKAKEITVSIDLRPVFSNKSCLGSWDNFYTCLQMQKNKTDEEFMQILDRAFYAKLICQKGCKDKSFLKWRVYWKSPETIMLKADISKAGDFADLEEAKKGIDKVNALLAKIIIEGPRFPKSKFEAIRHGGSFYVQTAPVTSYDFAKAMRTILNTLKNKKLLEGMSDADIASVIRILQGGKMVYYTSKKCGIIKTPKWRSENNAMPIHFDKNKCAHITITRGG
jgi:hypothetical protein